MKIVVLNGTELKGCTYRMKEVFLQMLGKFHEIREYYFPKDCPVFCTGCKACFHKDISICPHKEYTLPIWESIKEADLIVVTSPSYVFGPSAQLKAVLDHFATKWMAHSPEKEMFLKKAVILTNSIGAGMGNVVKVIGSSLQFWGISNVYVIRQALFIATWELVSEKRKQKILRQCQSVAKKISKSKGKVSVKTKFLFFAMRTAQKMIHKSEFKKGHAETQDHKHWQSQGWLKGKRPWKSETYSKENH